MSSANNEEKKESQGFLSVIPNMLGDDKFRSDLTENLKTYLLPTVIGAAGVGGLSAFLESRIKNKGETKAERRKRLLKAFAIPAVGTLGVGALLTSAFPVLNYEPEKKTSTPEDDVRKFKERITPDYGYVGLAGGGAYGLLKPPKPKSTKVEVPKRTETGELIFESKKVTPFNVNNSISKLKQGYDVLNPAQKAVVDAYLISGDKKVLKGHENLTDFADNYRKYNKLYNQNAVRKYLRENLKLGPRLRSGAKRGLVGGVSGAFALPILGWAYDKIMGE